MPIFQGTETNPLEDTNDLLAHLPEKGLANIYAANYPWLENYILQNSGNTSDAKDIFQESITAAWINLKQGRFTGSADRFNAYLRQICKHKWLNHLNSASFRKTQYKEDMNALDDAEQVKELPEEQLAQAKKLRECFEQIGEKCREILGLFYYRKKSLSEMASELNNTEESMKTIKYRCMTRLRNLFLDQK